MQVAMCALSVSGALIGQQYNFALLTLVVFNVKYTTDEHSKHYKL